MTASIHEFPQRPRRASMRLTEDSLAVAFVDEHAERLRFDHDTDRWYFSDGVGWRLAAKDEALELVRHLCRAYAARDGVGAKLQDKLGQKRTIAAIEALARSDDRVAIAGGDLDALPYALGTPEGIVSLKTQRLLPPERTRHLLVTKRTAVAPAEPGGSPRLWLAFLGEAMGGDNDLIDYLQLICGYLLTGCVHEQCMWFFWGPGGNGKSVFLNTVSGIMVDYARSAPMETFVATEAYRHETELAMMRGARLITAEETEKGRGLAEAKIKHLTGGGRISARLMRTDFFEFEPTFKIVLVGNHKPELHGVDVAIRRRLLLVPWTVQPKARDQLLERRLRPEWPLILRWMLAGTAVWRAGGLVTPLAVRAMTDDYLADQDSFGAWLAECCETDPPPINPRSGRSEMGGALFASWKGFCESRNERPGKISRLAGELKKKGFLSSRSGGGVRYFGLCLTRQALENTPISQGPLM